MQFNELRKELESIAFEKIRVDSNDYFEAVIVRNELEKLIAILEKFVSLAKNSPPLQIEEIINNFGGVRPGQSLYFSSQGKDILIAILWPWDDGWHTTVKIIQK